MLLSCGQYRFPRHICVQKGFSVVDPEPYWRNFILYTLICFICFELFWYRSLSRISWPGICQRNAEVPAHRDQECYEEGSSGGDHWYWYRFRSKRLVILFLAWWQRDERNQSYEYMWIIINPILSNFIGYWRIWHPGQTTLRPQECVRRDWRGNRHGQETKANKKKGSSAFYWWHLPVGCVPKMPGLRIHQLRCWMSRESSIRRIFLLARLTHRCSCAHSRSISPWWNATTCLKHGWGNEMPCTSDGDILGA